MRKFNLIEEIKSIQEIYTLYRCFNEKLIYE